MLLNDIIKELKLTQNKSDSPTDYEKALAKAFCFLGFQAKIIGGKGDTDVLLTANIGQESYKIDIDGKTSKTGKISEAQINWISLEDHKKKNNSDFVVVVGPGFAGGNLVKRAVDFNVSLLTTNELIKILEAHSRYPFTLLELKDLFAKAGEITNQIEDLLSQNLVRRGFLENFKIIIEEIEKLQNTSLGYFTFESIAGREKIQELEIELEDIKNIIQLLKIPFINAITEIDNNKFVLTLGKKDLSNTFYQISLVLEKKSEISTEKELFEKSGKSEVDEKLGTKYFKWEKRGNSIVASARKEKPYEHICPIEHFNTIVSKIIDAFQSYKVINNDTIFNLLRNQELSPNRIFKGKAEEYKIRLALGILELEGFIKWTGSLRPIEYTLEKSIEELIKWKEEYIDKQK